jgi:hypothetical protein
LAEEAIRTRKFAGIGFRGPEHTRRVWVIGTGLDVWEVIELYRGKGCQRLLSEHNVSDRQPSLALSYYEAYPQELDRALEENARSEEEWHALSPSVIYSMRTFPGERWVGSWHTTASASVPTGYATRRRTSSINTGPSEGCPIREDHGLFQAQRPGGSRPLRHNR